MWRPNLSRFFNASARRLGPLSPESINPLVLQASYAVRGPVLDAAMQLEKRLKAGEKLPFDRLVECNIGNPHALRQPPLSFVRQVLSLVLNPSLIENAPKFGNQVRKKFFSFLRMLLLVLKNI